MHTEDLSPWQHDHIFGLDEEQSGERRTHWVIGITLVTMMVELVAGYITGSMALTADGWHMSTHAAALAIAAFAYAFARNNVRNPRFTFGTGKVGPLGGFASAVALAIVALLMAVESLERLWQPVPVRFQEALAVAFIGLVVNLASAFILRDHHHHHFGHDHGHAPAHDHDVHVHHHHVHDDHDHHDHDHHDHDHHDHDHHDHDHDDHDHHDHDHDDHHDHPVSSSKHQDHNLRAAYLHVLADALTSVTALVALTCGMLFGWVWMDPMMGVVGSLVIAWWAYGLVRDTSQVLLDAENHSAIRQRIRTLLESQDDCRVSDLHVWRVGTASFSCIVSLVTAAQRPVDEYRRLLGSVSDLHHVTVEVHGCQPHP